MKLKLLLILVINLQFLYSQSFEGLPKPIQASIDSITFVYLPILNNKIQLINVQKNNLNKFLEEDSIRIGKIIPQFKIKFIFVDESLGIDSFIIELGFDEFGQLLTGNIPHRINPISVEKLIAQRTAIEYASNYFSAKNYTIDSLYAEFNYNDKVDSFVWLVYGYEKEKNNPDYGYERILEMKAESGDFISENYNSIYTIY